jgi:hypothetical protein
MERLWSKEWNITWALKNSLVTAVFQRREINSMMLSNFVWKDFWILFSGFHWTIKFCKNFVSHLNFLLKEASLVFLVNHFSLKTFLVRVNRIFSWLRYTVFRWTIFPRPDSCLTDWLTHSLARLIMLKYGVSSGKLLFIYWLGNEFWCICTLSIVQRLDEWILLCHHVKQWSGRQMIDDV